MLRIGIVGAGIRGKLFAQATVLNKNTTLVAFCDINHEIASATAKEYSVVAYEKYDDMFLKEKLDVVCITTPDFAHKDVVISAAKYKVGIFLEKPMATSFDECVSMEKAIKKTNVPFTVAYTNRWNPPYKRAKEIIEKGELGEILNINARLNNSITIPTDMLKWSGKSSPGWFLMSHALDLALWYTKKKIVRVYANGVKNVLVKKGIDTWDYIHAIVTFEDGTDAMFESCWVLPNGLPKMVDYKYQIVGTKGVLNLDMQDQMIHFTNDEKMVFPDTFMIDLHGHLFGHNLVCFDSFIDSIENKTDPIVNIEEAITNVRVIEAIHRSLVEKTHIDINYGRK